MRHFARHLKAVSALLAIGLLAVVAGGASHPVAGETSATNPAFPEIILQINDTTVSPYDTNYYLSVYLTNTLQEVAGMEITFFAEHSGLVGLPASERIDTLIICSDSVTCDTTIDTVSVSPVDYTGSDIGYWEFLQARALSPDKFRFVGLADYPGGSTTPPLPVATEGPHFLFRVLLNRLVDLPTLDTLTERSVKWIFTAPTNFSSPDAEIIGLQESTYCVNPPVCDTIDTIAYIDSTINVYVSGILTIGPQCMIGDVDASGSINAADVIALVDYVFRAGATPACGGAAGDANCSGSVNSADIIVIVNYVFRGGAILCG